MSLKGRARRAWRLTKRGFWTWVYRALGLPEPDFDWFGNRFKHPGIELLGWEWASKAYEAYKRWDAERDLRKGFRRIRR